MLIILNVVELAYYIIRNVLVRLFIRSTVSNSFLYNNYFAATRVLWAAVCETVPVKLKVAKLTRVKQTQYFCRPDSLDGSLDVQHTRNQVARQLKNSYQLVIAPEWLTPQFV